MIDLLKLSLMLALTVYLLMRKWNLGLVLILDSALVALLFLYPPLSFLSSLVQGIIGTQTLSLAGAVFLVLVLAELLRRSRSMERMVTALQAVIPDSRVVLALIPTTIGLMPMLGGAMFSAPMVEGIASRLQLSPGRKTFINYWFRHAVEYVFPLYSSVLVVSALLEVSPQMFIQAAYPLALAAVTGGILWGLLGTPRPEREAKEEPGNPRPRRLAWRDLFLSAWPLLLVILLVAVLKWHILLSVGGVILLMMVIHRVGPSQWLDMLKRSFPPRTFSAILGVMIFKRVVEDAGAVQSVPTALSQFGLPPLLIAFLVPHLAGLLTGTPPAAMALGVPLVAPLMASLPLNYVAGGVWMFVGAFSGVLLSPLHLCLALTREYFGANWGRLYRAIIPATILIVATAFGNVLLRPPP
jgi:integral membrane protein (TIGR00529 family)